MWIEEIIYLMNSSKKVQPSELFHVYNSRDIIKCGCLNRNTNNAFRKLSVSTQTSTNGM